MAKNDTGNKLPMVFNTVLPAGELTVIITKLGLYQKADNPPAIKNTIRNRNSFSLACPSSISEKVIAVKKKNKTIIPRGEVKPTKTMPTLAPGQYYWRVKAGRMEEGSQIFFGWSDVWGFTVIE